MPTLLQVGVALMVLASSAAAKSSRSQLQTELRSLYVGKVIVFDYPYTNREQIYDSKGNLQGRGIPACADGQSRFHVDKVSVKGREIRLEGRRDLTEVLFRSQPRRKDRPRSERLLVRIRSAAEPWNADLAQAAIEAILHPKLEDQGSLPPGATAAPPGSDARIVYILAGNPVYHAENGIRKPRALYAPDPEYTEAARKSKAQGKVWLNVVVGEDGLPELVEVTGRRLGYGLDEASVNTIKRWRFEPGRLDGRPVQVLLSVTMTFCLY